MNLQPIIFHPENLNQEIIKAYKDYQQEARQWWSNIDNENTENYGVDPTTYRALKTGKSGDNSPSKTYRKWAKAKIEEIKKDQPYVISMINTQENFDGWHEELATHLEHHWNAIADENNNLLLAHRYKLIDLFIKYLRCEDELDNPLKKHLLTFGHTPLDKKSLTLIHAIFNLANANFSMGHVTSKNIYTTYQGLVRNICKQVNSTPLLFDVFVFQSPYANQLLQPSQPASKSKKTTT